MCFQDTTVHVTSSRADGCKQRLPVTHLPLPAKLRLSFPAPPLEFGAGGVEEARGLGLRVHAPRHAHYRSMTCRWSLERDLDLRTKINQLFNQFNVRYFPEVWCVLYLLRFQRATWGAQLHANDRLSGWTFQEHAAASAEVSVRVTASATFRAGQILGWVARLREEKKALCH